MQNEKRIPADLLAQLNNIGFHPIDLVLYINSKCNLRCKHCYLGNELLSQNQYFNLEDLIGFIKKFKHLDRLTILGGEPFLYDNLETLINSIEIAKIHEFRITTNLNSIDVYKKFSQYAKEKIRICASLDGHNAQLHDYIRGERNFEKTVKNIRNIINMGADVEVTHTIMSKNILYFEEFLKLCQAIGISKINIHRVSLQGNALINSDLEVTPTEYINFCNKLRSMQGKLDKKISIRFPILFANDFTYNEIKERTNYLPHSQKSYYGQGHRIVLYPNCHIYISSEFFGTESYVGHFDNEKFYFNQSLKNELLFFQNKNASISDLNKFQKGDENYPIVLSVSFKETIII
jgi:MoaA/NifB/PqqE/SkfB family radical SAM enzyme